MGAKGIRINTNKDGDLTIQVVVDNAMLSTMTSELSSQNQIAPRILGTTIPPVANKLSKRAVATTAPAGDAIPATYPNEARMYLNPPSSTSSLPQSCAGNVHVSPTELCRRLKRVIKDREYAERNAAMQSSEFSQSGCIPGGCMTNARTDNVGMTNKASHSSTTRKSTI